MGMLSLADILLTDAQVSYKENRIILYFKSDAEVNPIFKEHVRSLYAKFVKQESVSVTIGEHSFESHIISLASAASPEEYVSDDPVERLMCGDEFTITVENNGHIAENTAERPAAPAAARHFPVLSCPSAAGTAETQSRSSHCADAPAVLPANARPLLRRAGIRRRSGCPADPECA